MELIFNDTILSSGKFKGQKAISVWKYNPRYFRKLEKEKLAKVYIFPEYINSIADIEKIQLENENNWKAEKPYKITWVFKYWKRMISKMKSYEKRKQLSLF